MIQTEIDLKENILKRIKQFDQSQIVIFARLWAIRTLPFIGTSGNFTFLEPKHKVYEYLFTILNAIDIVADYKCSALKDYTDLAIAASDAAREVVEAVRKVRDNPYNPLSSDGTQAAYKTLRTVSVAAAAVSAAANIHSAISDLASVVAEIVKNESELDSILEDDISKIKAKNYKNFINGIRIYGKTWENFQKALDDVGCGYWGRLYSLLFHDKFQFDQDELKIRLNVPQEEKNKGAKAVADYLIKKEEEKRLEVFINDCNDCKDRIIFLLKKLDKNNILNQELSYILQDLEKMKKLPVEEIIQKNLRERLKSFILDFSYPDSQTYKTINNIDYGIKTAEKIKEKCNNIDQWIDLQPDPKIRKKWSEDQVKKRRSRRTEVFISYSRKDSDVLMEIVPYLENSLLKSVGKIEIWYDKKIRVGEWYNELKEHLSNTRFGILLISNAFLESHFIRKDEVPELIQAYVDGIAGITWIPLEKIKDETKKIYKIKRGTKKDISVLQAACDSDNYFKEMELNKKIEVYDLICEFIKDEFNIS